MISLSFHLKELKYLKYLLFVKFLLIQPKLKLFLFLNSILIVSTSQGVQSMKKKQQKNILVAVL